MAVQNPKSGFLGGLIAALCGTFVVGFCYGFIIDPPADHAKAAQKHVMPNIGNPGEQPRTGNTAPPKHQPDPRDATHAPPDAAVASAEGTGHEDLGSLPLTSIIDIEMTPEKRAAQEEEAARTIAELTREAMNKFDKVDPDARKPRTPDPKTAQPATGAAQPDGDGAVEVIPFPDPEQDLISSKPVPPLAARPENLSAHGKKGDELLEQAKELMRKWDKVRTQKGGGHEARRLMDQAKKTLEQAKTCYRKALAVEPDSTYIKQQLELTNQLHYAAMKSSSF